MNPDPNSPEVAAAFNRYHTVTWDGTALDAMAAAIEAYLAACLASGRAKAGSCVNDPSWPGWRADEQPVGTYKEWFPVLIIRLDGGSDE